MNWHNKLITLNTYQKQSPRYNWDFVWKMTNMLVAFLKYSHGLIYPIRRIGVFDALYHVVPLWVNEINLNFNQSMCLKKILILRYYYCTTTTSITIFSIKLTFCSAYAPIHRYFFSCDTKRISYFVGQLFILITPDVRSNCSNAYWIACS